MQSDTTEAAQQFGVAGFLLPLGFSFFFSFFSFPISLSCFCSTPNHFEPLKCVGFSQHSLMALMGSKLKQTTFCFAAINASGPVLSLQSSVPMRDRKEFSRTRSVHAAFFHHRGRRGFVEMPSGSLESLMEAVRLDSSFFFCHINWG